MFFFLDASCSSRRVYLLHKHLGIHRRSRAHTHARHRASREAAAGSAVGRAEGGGLRLPDAQSHLALTVEGWSGEERRTEPGSAGKWHRDRSAGAEVDETRLPRAPPSSNWIPTCGGWGDRADTAGEVPAFGRCRGGSCLLPVLRWEGVASGENADGGGDCRRRRAHFGGRVGTRAGE